MLIKIYSVLFLKKKKKKAKSKSCGIKEFNTKQNFIKLDLIFFEEIIIKLGVFFQQFLNVVIYYLCNFLFFSCN